MHGKPRTKKQARRIELITHVLGCLACHIEGFGYEPCDYHHCDDQKQDHDRGYGLCPWHHRAVPTYGVGGSNMIGIKGPCKSMKEAFLRKYGTEQELLDLQNERIEEWEKSNVNSESFVTD